MRIHLPWESKTARFWRLFKSGIDNAYASNCFGIAKGAAYSALLSFFPILTTVAALLVQVRADDVSRIIAGFLYEVVPPGAEEVVRNLFVVHGRRPSWLLVVATLLSAWAASGAMMSIMEGFRAIYHIPEARPFLKERGMAILLVFMSILPVWGATGLVVFGSRLEAYMVYAMRLAPDGSDLSLWVSLFSQAVRYSLAFFAFVLATALVYYFGPNRPQKFRFVVPGAILATFFWLLATLAVGWYVRHVTDYNVLYGSVGAGLALLVWMYVLAVITLVGCAFNAVREAG